MKIEFDVKMTTAKLYDYMLYHTFRSFMGILGEIVGVLLIATYFYANEGTTNKWLYLVFGIIVLFYQPVSLYMSAKKQMLLNPAFKEIIHYTLDEEGVTVSIKDESESQKWEDMHRACMTTASVIIYTNRINSCIFPKADIGDKLKDVIYLISTHMPPEKVKFKTMG